jgi:hypothetical protein
MKMLERVAFVSAMVVVGCGSRESSTITLASSGTGGESATGGTGGNGGLGGNGGTAGAAGRPRWCDTEDGSEILTDDYTEVRDATVDATHLYFTHNYPEISVYRMPLEAGAQVETHYRFPGAALFGFELHDRDVWWLVHPSVTLEDPYASKLYRGNTAGDPPQLVIERGVQTIVSAPAGLIVVRLPEPRPRGVYAILELMPWSGGATTRICEINESAGLATNDTTLVAIDTDSIFSCPLSGGTPTTLVDLPELALSTGLGVDSTHVYWRVESVYQRMPLAGGTPEFVHEVPEYAGTVTGFATGILLDGDSLFYGLDDRMLSVPKTGGVPVEVVPKQNQGMTFFTLSSTHYYWGEGDFSGLHCIKRKPR